MTGYITVVSHGIPVKEVISTINGFKSLVPSYSMMKTHFDVVTRKTPDILSCLILAQHVIVLVNSLEVSIGRLSNMIIFFY